MLWGDYESIREELRKKNPKVPTGVFPVINIVDQSTSTIYVTFEEIDGFLFVNAEITHGAELNYQWYCSNFNKLEGITEDLFYIPKNLEIGMYFYFCEISAVGAVSVKSNVVTVIVCCNDHFYENGICNTCYDIEMILIPGGTFNMGSPTGAGNENEHPQWQVSLSDFYMSKFLVTQELYENVMRENPSYFPSDPANGEVQSKRPAEGLSWYEAIVFCNRFSLREGLYLAYEIPTLADKTIWSTDPSTWGAAPYYWDERWDSVRIVQGSTGYRLPTEAQWEFASRAGTASSWHFGNNEIEIGNYAWYTANSENITHQVGTKQPNQLGLYDMYGNVLELCWDWFEFYPGIITLDPMGPNSGNIRIRRGGGWNSAAADTRSAYRTNTVPYMRNGSTGFRLVRPLS